jgi:hypothetical protein
MADEEKQWYDLVKHNFLNPDPATTKVVRTARGLGKAQRIADVLTKALPSEEREAGFRVYCEEGSKPAKLALGRKVRKQPDERRRRRR